MFVYDHSALNVIYINILSNTGKHYNIISFSFTVIPILSGHVGTLFSKLLLLFEAFLSDFFFVSLK